MACARAESGRSDCLSNLQESRKSREYPIFKLGERHILRAVAIFDYFYLAVFMKDGRHVL